MTKETFMLNSLEEYKDYLERIADANAKVAEASAKLLRSDKYMDSVMSDDDLSEREFIEIIAMCRQVNYNKSIGGANKAAENETDRLYAKNSWKFVEEFLQNADDCDYDAIPEISIIVDERDDSHCYIEFIYNEEGFTRNDIWAITAFSESTKVNDTVRKQKESGVFYKEKTGRKGKGFKSVFSLNAENIIVHIRSNGFSFKLDNRIGRIMPVWEDDPARMDGKTHIIVELYEPHFSVKEIYPEFRRLFCIDNHEEIFAHSPFLFMHRIRMVHVTQISEDGEETFITEYRENDNKTVYATPISLNSEKIILAGIAKDGIFYHEQYQEGEITTLSGDGTSFVIPLIRYTRMVEDDRYYRNYSVMAPIIKSGSHTEWRGGAMFRTFPMSLHPIMMPIAIDAPFILNPDRSGIQYSSYKDEDGNLIPASTWNTEVARRLFEKDGVFEAFFLWLRSIKGVRVDQYLKSQPILLFEDKSNSDGHGNTWVPQYDLGEQSRSLPIFRLFNNDNDYVSYNDAWLINKDFFKWPCIEKLLSLLFEDDYKSCILSEIYIGSSLFQAKPIVKSGFVDAMNEYLNVVENHIGLDTPEMFDFVNKRLYPFLKDNARLLNREEKDAFKRLCIYFSRIQKSDGIYVVRESGLHGTKWIHDERGEKHPSINRYRIYESSPVNIASLGDMVENSLGKKNLFIEFGEVNQAAVARSCKTWEAIRDYIEAVVFYGFPTKKLQFPYLQKYVLSEKLDLGFNAFRDTGLLEMVNDEDVRKLSRYFSGNIKQTASILKQMGVKEGDDYFKNEGIYLTFREDTIDLLKSASCPIPEVLQEIKKKKENLEKKINADYKTVGSLREDVLIYFLDESNGLFSLDSYVSICESIQSCETYWKRNDTAASEILLRACAGATNALPEKSKKNRNIEIDIETVLRNHLESTVVKVSQKNILQRLTIINNGFFEEITQQEITPLLSILDYDGGMSHASFYKGNMLCYGGKRLFLRDFKGGNIYLNCDSSGDFKEALGECVKKRFDTEKLKYYDEMEQQYRDVKEQIIVPLFNRTGHDLSRTYEEIERRFEEYDKRQIISILSWFRAQGYTNALGNGNINNEKEIEDDYREEPWKFIYEFIQNVDDCTYKEKSPSLTIEVSKELGQISFEYNETGFSLDDVKALTKFGDSNKADLLDEQNTCDGIFDREKTGRKGRGFKSVFAIPGDGIVVHICSNGFSFKFVKRLGHIIPIWEEVFDSPVIGTRITIEGMQDAYMEKLIPYLRSMFGIDNISTFFANCPVLFLRKLEKVKVVQDEEEFTINIHSKGKPRYTEKSPEFVKNEVAGIRYGGRLRVGCYEDIKIAIETSEYMHSIDAIRYTRAFGINDSSRIIQAISPIIRQGSDTVFNKGALYRTLPLTEHTFSIPIALNGPFDTNSGRNRIENNKHNNVIASEIVRKFFFQYYMKLRKYPNINIEKYIPLQQDVLFEGYDKVVSIDLYSKIRTYAVLKKYGKEEYVSCDDAKVLPVECYQWERPDILSECFDSTNSVLVEEQYASVSLAKTTINLISHDFVQNINEYLNRISLNERDKIDLLRNNIYPYINDNYEAILSIYRAEDRQGELKNLQIFVFQMADGRFIRESADVERIWIKNMPEKYYSFGRFRNLANSSIKELFAEYNWDYIFPTIEEYERAFTGENLRTRRVNNWEQTKELIESILYYDVKQTMRIPFLSKCVLSGEIDKEENLFRIAYEETKIQDILNHIITITDISDIRVNVIGKEDITIDLIVDLIKNSGIRNSNDFFSENERGIAHLNKETIAILESFCRDRETAGLVLRAIDSAFHPEARKKNVSLHITYEDIKESEPVVFSKIFEYELIRGETERHLAREFCRKYPGSKSCDYTEAYLRALNVIGKPNDSDDIGKLRDININLSEVMSRCLGPCLQNCKINNLEKLPLLIDIDVKILEYPSEETEKALKWLDDDSNAVSVTYDYYKADLSRAFSEGTEASHRYLFDDSIVIVDSDDPQNSMLQFVQGRYKGKDTSFKELLLIIAEQNKLKSPWKGTKEEYVRKLKNFRNDTLMKQKVLFPNYDKHLNDANGKAMDYVIPELLQNINDCKPAEGQVTRTLTVSIHPEDGTMMLQYDEAGFDYSNVYSITAIGQSSKHDESEGEKGLGFKKVFSLFEIVEIYSNGFAFSLNAEKNTVPVWIQSKEKQKKYMKTGKTTMLFSTSGSNKQKLSVILNQWKELLTGHYIGNKISPIFLRNIDYIYLEGCMSHYSRTEMEKDFIYLRTPLLAFYNKILMEKGTVAKEHIANICQRLKTRRKCSTMTEDEKEKYLDSLTIDVAIPKLITNDNRGKGCFYSTLPTERFSHTTTFINVPLELTTGRDGIIEDSEYNKTVFEMLFVPYYGCTPVFNKILEIFADENREIFMLDYIYPETEKFVESIATLLNIEDNALYKGLEKADLFQSYGSDNMVSIASGYSVDHILYLYCKQVKDQSCEIEEWIQKEVQSIEGYSLLRLSTNDQCDHVERFAKTVNAVEGYFPLIDEEKDLVIDYLSNEYGYVGESDEGADKE